MHPLIQILLFQPEDQEKGSKTLAVLPQKREDTKVSNIRNERGNITIDSADIKRTIRELQATVYNILQVKQVYHFFEAQITTFTQNEII